MHSTAHSISHPPDGSPQKAVLITVDVEDWFQVENLRSVYPPQSWNSCELRVEASTQKVLDLLDSYQVKGTFFVLGWIAERCPGVVRDIFKRGHEVASHGYGHQLCFDLSREVLHEDLYRSKAIIEDITGSRVMGYRAPSFSVTEKVIDVLGELNYTYDSSYNDFSLNKRYGTAVDLFRVLPQNRLVARNGIVEIPLSNFSVLGNSIPWAGGGYFRFWPTALFEAGVARLLQKNYPYVFYCHPWEFDYAQPRADGIGTLSRFRHYINLRKTLDRLGHFLSRFRDCAFCLCGDYVSDCECERGSRS